MDVVSSMHAFGRGTADERRPTILLLEDDDGDALLVEELLVDAAWPFDLLRVRSLSEARSLLGTVDGVLADLGLPDASGLGAVEHLRRDAPDLPLVVLTGSNDRERGLAALAAGAQDYLVKGEIDGAGLTRAVRYAVERRHAELDARRLLVADQRQAENLRLARGLLPRLDVGGCGVRTATRYLPGGRDALLGGDFFDAVQRADGTVRAVIGDVCGHGPDEAAIGVALRIAWRTMVLADATPADTLRAVDEMLRHEAQSPALFTTVCDLTVHPAEGRATVRLHGHQPPLLLAPALRFVDEAHPSPPLGVLTYEPAAPAELALGHDWALLLATDGLHEARTAQGRLGLESLLEMAADLAALRDDPEQALEELLARAISLHGAEPTDDVALLWLGSQP